MKILAAFLVLVTSAFPDTLVVKNGKPPIEWKSLVDLGDSYQVELTSGAKVTVLKADVEQIVISQSKPPLTGASFTMNPIKGKVRTYNALGAIDPKKDVFGMNKDCWFKVSGQTVNAFFGSDKPDRAQIPIKVSEEYDLSMIVERKAGTSNFYVGLIGGGNPFLFTFDGEGMTRSGTSGAMKETKPVFVERKPVSVLFRVRKNGWKVLLDGKEFAFQENGFGSMPSDHALPDSQMYLFFGSQKIFGTPTNSWQISKVILTQSE